LKGEATIVAKGRRAFPYLKVATLPALIIVVLLALGCATAPGGRGHICLPSITSDGSGGAIVAYEVFENDDLRSTYVQRIGAGGHKLWGEKGVLLYTARGTTVCPKTLTDGSGGAIILWHAWQERREVLAQRFDSKGLALWQEDGVPILPGPEVYCRKAICDDSGGIIIYGSKKGKGYIKRIDSKGNFLWAKDTSSICSKASHIAEMASDNSGGVIIILTSRFGTFAQRIDSEGNILWGESGLQVCNYGTYKPGVISDSSGGAIIVWAHRERTKEGQQISSIYTQRVGAEGNILWQQGGLCVCSSSQLPLGYPRIVSDGSGGAIITWMTHNDLYVQRLDPEGNVLWSEDGIRVQGSEGPQSSSYRVVADGSGGAILVFEKRSGRVPERGKPIYAQRIDAEGRNCWGPNGVLVSPGYWGFTMPPVVSEDGLGGVIVSWTAGTPFYTGLTYIQRINAEGERMWGDKGILLTP